MFLDTDVVVPKTICPCPERSAEQEQETKQRYEEPLHGIVLIGLNISRR
jgi:hypothetical protein